MYVCIECISSNMPIKASFNQAWIHNIYVQSNQIYNVTY